MNLVPTLTKLKLGLITVAQAQAAIEPLLAFREDLTEALDQTPSFWFACRARWPKIQRGEVGILHLLIHREFISNEAFFLYTKTEGGTTIKVWICRLRKYTGAQIINVYGKGYKMEPADRKRLKKELIP